MRFLSRHFHTYGFSFLILPSLLFFFLRLPSLFEPNWYGDEGIYQTIGLALKNGALLYKDIWDNKPPILYILYGLFGGDQFSLRVLSLLFGIATIIAIFILAKKLSENLLHLSKTQARNFPFNASLLFSILFGSPLLEGNIANAENFMLLPIICAGILIVSEKTTHGTRNLFIAGLLSSLAFLTKIVGLFDFTAFLAFLIFMNFESFAKVPILLKKLWWYPIGFGAPILGTIIFFFVKGAFKEFYQGAFTQMIGYVGYGNRLIIPQGLLVIKIILLATFLLVLFKNRNRIHTSILFILIWLSFSLFNTFFAQRPYVHYLLVLLPSFCLLSAYVYSLVIDQILTPKTLYTKTPIFIGGVLLFVVLLVHLNFTLYTKTIPYYGNFINFILGSKDVASYYEFFDRKTPRDYQLAQYILLKTKPSDNIFIWGNNAQIYKLTNKLPPGRFTVAYHITAKKETLDETYTALLKQKPKYILVTTNSPIPYSLTQYVHRLNIQEAAVYERTY